MTASTIMIPEGSTREKPNQISQHNPPYPTIGINGITSYQLNLNIEKDIIIGNKDSVHFRLATKQNGNDVSLLISKYNKEEYMGNLLELGDGDEYDVFHDFDFGSGSGTGTGVANPTS